MDIFIPIGRRIKQELVKEKKIMPAVSRKGDSLSTGHGCVSTTTLDTPGQGSVFANNILVARIGDPTVSHPISPLPKRTNHVANVNAGSQNVFVVGIKVGRIGDSADAGGMTSGSGNVFANGQLKCYKY